MEDLPLPTEPIGSIPRPRDLVTAAAAGDGIGPDVAPLYQQAVRDTIRLMEETGSPVVTDGEQGKYHNFWTYPVHGMANTARDGFAIPFRAGHVRRMLRLVRGPFPLWESRRPAPRGGVAEEFLEHLLQEHIAEVRSRG